MTSGKATADDGETGARTGGENRLLLLGVDGTIFNCLTA